MGYLQKFDFNSGHIATQILNKTVFSFDNPFLQCAVSSIVLLWAMLLFMTKQLASIEYYLLLTS